MALRFFMFVDFQSPETIVLYSFVQLHALSMPEVLCDILNLIIFLKVPLVWAVFAKTLSTPIFLQSLFLPFVPLKCLPKRGLERPKIEALRLS